MKSIRKQLVNPSVRINRDSPSFLKQKEVFNNLICEKRSLYNLETLSKTRKSIINYLNGCSSMVSKAKYRKIWEKGLKILTQK